MSPTSLNPMALSVTDLARLLSHAGGQPIARSRIEQDLVEGAPRNADGTLNLVYYAAWLVQEVSRGD